MDRNSIDWAGSFPALTTPFDQEGRIDEKAFAANVDRLIAAGANGFVVAGCTGEFWSLSHEERKRYYELARRGRRRPRYGHRRHGRRDGRRDGEAHQHGEQGRRRRRPDPAALFREAHR